MASPATYVVMPYRAAWDWVWLPMHRARTADRSVRPAAAAKPRTVEALVNTAQVRSSRSARGSSTGCLVSAVS